MAEPAQAGAIPACGTGLAVFGVDRPRLAPTLASESIIVLPATTKVYGTANVYATAILSAAAMVRAGRIVEPRDGDEDQ